VAHDVGRKKKASPSIVLPLYFPWREGPGQRVEIPRVLRSALGRAPSNVFPRHLPKGFADHTGRRGRSVICKAPSTLGPKGPPWSRKRQATPASSLANGGRLGPRVTPGSIPWRNPAPVPFVELEDRRWSIIARFSPGAPSKVGSCPTARTIVLQRFRHRVPT